MKKIFGILMASLLGLSMVMLSSCSKDKDSGSLEGVWAQTLYVDEEYDEEYEVNYKRDGGEILTFKSRGNDMYYLGYYWTQDEPDEWYTYSEPDRVMVEGKRLYWDDEEYIIKTLTSKKLVLYSEESEERMEYEKLSDNPKEVGKFIDYEEIDDWKKSGNKSAINPLSRKNR